MDPARTLQTAGPGRAFPGLGMQWEGLVMRCGGCRTRRLLSLSLSHATILKYRYRNGTLITREKRMLQPHDSRVMNQSPELQACLTRRVLRSKAPLRVNTVMSSAVHFWLSQPHDSSTSSSVIFMPAQYNTRQHASDDTTGAQQPK